MRWEWIWVWPGNTFTSAFPTLKQCVETMKIFAGHPIRVRQCRHKKRCRCLEERARQARNEHAIYVRKGSLHSNGVREYSYREFK